MNILVKISTFYYFTIMHCGKFVHLTFLCFSCNSFISRDLIDQYL